VLAAVEAARPRVVVGPPELAPLLPAHVVLTSEQPPGGGPVAGVAAGLAAGLDHVAWVAVLGADLPFLDAATVASLHSALSGSGDAVDGAMLVDDAGRWQWLAGVWRRSALQDRLSALGDPAGCSMKALVADLTVIAVDPPAAGPPPWFDCDTVEDLRRAEEIAHDHAG
jgi:molybdopterin-guanine dinucleotide biosynthesis protein A